MVTRVHSAPVDPLASSAAGAVAASTSLVLASSALSSPVAVTTRLNVRGDFGLPSDTYVWSAPSQNVASYVAPTPLTDSPEDYASDATDEEAPEYIYGSAARNISALTPAAQYLFYASLSTRETGQLIDVYA